MYLNSIQLNLNSSQIQFKLQCNVVHSSISCRNELVSLTSRTFKNVFILSQDFYFSCFFNAFNLCAK
jgi:hypothetical protein